MRFPNKLERSLLAISIIGAIVIASGVTIMRVTVRSAVEDDARIMAQGWAEYLSTSLTDIEQIASGAAPSLQSLRVLQFSQAAGDVFRYKIFGPDGRLALVSDDPGYAPAGNADLGDHSRAAARVVATGVPYVEIKQGDRILRPLYFGEAYVPLMRDGKPIATVEVYVDLTDHQAALERTFSTAILKILGVLALGFAIPAGAYYFSTRGRAVMEDHLDHVIRHDGLTGAMNRAAFSKRVNGLIAEGTRFAIHYLDLDRFKSVNDMLGHSIGDTLLREVADRLVTAAGEDCFVGRLGGDEFAVCQFADSSSVIHRFAEHLVRTMSKPFRVDGNDVGIGCSIGFGRFPENGKTASELLHAADVALHRAKTTGRGRSVGYHLSMEKERQERHTIEKDLRRALAASAFELNYQPLFRTDDCALRGFEALLRMRDETGNPVPPSVFIPIAEEIGLIGRIGDWVISEACRFAATWPQELSVAVNLSPVQFEDGDLLMKIRAALKESGLAPERLELEITESLLITNTDCVLAQLGQLRALGIRIALDDFGTGFSSLSYLWRFPFDKLKIDRAFVRDIEDKSSKSREILKTVVTLGQVLDLSVTAEGVETAGQLAALKELKCDLTQGFLLGRPMPESDIAPFVLKALGRIDRADKPAPASRRAGS